jgi:hypothetical protein
MNNTLKRIIKRSNTRKLLGKKATAWYKISRGGKCPDKDDNSNIVDNYYKHFNCDSYNHREIQEMRGKDAGQCAAERMSDTKQRILRGLKVDIGHIHPIKIAYDMGKNCLKNTLLYNSYINKFKKYYKELIAVKPELHYIFQTALKVEGEYPLELNTENITEVETKNPIVYQNNKNSKRTNTQKQNNKTIKHSNKITLV